jgi:hypothetical protein
LKIGRIAARGIGANLDVAIGNGGATGFHRFSPSGIAPERMLACRARCGWAVVWRSAQRVCWPNRREDNVVNGPSFATGRMGRTGASWTTLFGR